MARDVISLILDTDIGDDVDDAFALAFAARHPKIRLCAVTTVLGDTRWRAALALRLLDELGVSDVPVAAGEPGAAPSRASPSRATWWCRWAATIPAAIPVQPHASWPT